MFFVTHLAAFVVGLQWGIIGIAAGYAISTTLVEPLYAWITARAVGISVLAFARSLAGVAPAALVMAVCVLALRLELLHTGIPTSARLGLCVLVGTVLYLPLCGLLAPELRLELRRLRGAES